MLLQVTRLCRRVLLPEDEEGEPIASWEAHFGPGAWTAWEKEQLLEAHFNVSDLATEYETYKSAGRGRVPLHS